VFVSPLFSVRRSLLARAQDLIGSRDALEVLLVLPEGGPLRNLGAALVDEAELDRRLHFLLVSLSVKSLSV